MKPGEVVLENASRSFDVRPEERSRTLKEVFIRRGHKSGHGRVNALSDVSLHIEPGEAVAFLGRNGAGKTSTLRCLAGIVPLDSGRAECGGTVVSLLDLGAGFGPEFSGRENILLNGALHGFTREQIEARVDDIVDFSELGEFIDVPVKTYSAGMFLRLGFSIAAFLDADVMLIDEVLAVGDEAFQRKCLRRIGERMDAGATLVLVSHDPTAIERVCERVVVLDGGEVQFDGGVAEGLLFYHRLLGAEGAGSRKAGGPGSVVEIELHDSEGRPRHAFRSGEPLRVRMNVIPPPESERSVLALEVRQAEGGLCFRTDTALSGAGDEEVEVSFEVPRLALLGGDYDLAVGVADQDAPPAGSLDRLARFSVMRTLEAEGVADLRGAWTVAGERATEEALR